MFRLKLIPRLLLAATHLAATSALVLAVAGSASAASFMELPFFNAWDISADGLTVVGASASPVRWTAAGGVEPLPVPLGSAGGAARAVSADGSVAVGLAYREQSLRWGSGGFQVLSPTPSAAYGISADASVVVGTSRGRPVRWDLGGGEVLLPETTGGLALGVTPDGSRIVGQAWVSPGFEAVEWTGGGMTVLVNLGGGSAARAIASDGRTIVGQVAPFGSGARHVAALWRDGDLTTLGTIPGTYQSDAWDVSGDGSIVVGFAGVSLFQGKRAVIWDESSGMRDLKQELEDVHGLDLGEWSLEVATGISRDGTIIVGNGSPRVGRMGSWIAVLPRPPEPVTPVEVDIKPGSCPNSWNRESNGVLPVSILGTENFDVTEIDVSSVMISRADGTGGSVGPNEGPPGPHSVFEDVGTPFEGEVCDCHEAEGDGILDLSMKFRTQDVADLLPVDDPSGALVPLVVSGTLLDGTPFTSSSDCVRLVPPGTPPGQVTVESAPGSWVDAAPLDNQLDGGGFGSFTRAYPNTTWLTLTAPLSHNGNPFVGWKVDERELVQGRSITFIVNNAEHSAKAVFKKANGCGLGFELALLVPPLMCLRERRRRRMQ